MEITAKWLADMSQIALRVKDIYAPGTIEFQLAQAVQRLIIAWVELEVGRGEK